MAALHTVLSHLASKGVFLEPEPGRFSLNEAAPGLLDPHQRVLDRMAGAGSMMGR